MSQDWRKAALCRHFPDLPWIAEPRDRSLAAEILLCRVCAACPVRTECWAYVELSGIVSGFWAGSDRAHAYEVSETGGAA
jgi:hypothetical protein